MSHCAQWEATVIIMFHTSFAWESSEYICTCWSCLTSKAVPTRRMQGWCDWS